MQIKKFIHANRSQAEDLLKDLIKIPSISGAEFALGKFLCGFLQANKIKYEIQKTRDENFNVIIWIGKGEKTIIYNTHLDTVRPSADLWKVTSPFMPLQRKNRIYGLGASDAKGPLTSLLLTAKYLKNIPLKGRICFSFVTSEEIDGSGTGYFLDQNKFNPQETVALICEPTRLEKISIGNRGSAFLKFVILGKGGHASRPKDTVNPIDFIAKFKEFEKKLQENFADKFLGEPTFTPTSVVAGMHTEGNKLKHVSYNTIPGKMEIIFDVRMTEGLFEKQFQNLKQAIDQFTKNQKGNYQIEWQFMETPTEGHKIDKESPLVKIASKVIEKNLGKKPEIVVSQGANDAFLFSRKGISAINEIGPGEGKVAHQKDEFIEIKNILEGIEFYIRFACEFLE